MSYLPKIDTDSILQGFPHSAMILDRQFNILAMNRLMEATTGRNLDDVVGINGEFVLCTNTGNNRGQLFQQVRDSKEAVTVKGDMINGYRRKLSVQFTISPLVDSVQELCGFLVIIEDLSEYTSAIDTSRAHQHSSDIIGYSPKMQKVMDLIPLMSQTDASVMITGETGTGKDKIAEVIHKNSPRARFPFIKVNCGALPAGLLESELFGHVKGAFTGATRNKPGMFKMADKGTLFLTEIGDMPLPLQVKLLSVLDDKEFIPVGGEQKVSVDVRIIAATHRPLREQIQNNQFREDLFYRLHVLHVHLPPLRERDGDLRYLLDHFNQMFSKDLSKSAPSFSKEAMEILLAYKYPGNIRELKNIVEYGVNICGKNNIGKDFLPPYLYEQVPHSLIDNQPEIIEERIVKNVVEQVVPVTSTSEKQSWNDIERDIIVESLKKSDGNRLATAADLGWGRMKLWRRMKKYGLL